jgi:alanine-synthesizing transaminase
VFPAREAVVMQQQDRGIQGVAADHVFMGNGVSELIDLTMRALLDPGDEVLIPSPDYPLWTASVTLNRGTPVHYPCAPENGFQPDLQALARLVTPRTRGIVVINPNNPTGAVYSRDTLLAIAALAAQHRLIVFSDEIYDQMTYGEAQSIPMATLVRETLCATFSGLSKVYRACGYRVGWVVFSGDLEHAQGYLEGLDLLASLRLCSNVPGQWAVQTALGGFQSIRQLVRPGGRLFESRQALIDGVARSRYLTMVAPAGAMYAFVGIRHDVLPGTDDQQFALDLLEKKHVLVAPGTSFNTSYNNYFRVTNLPDPETLVEVFQRIEELLDDYAADKAAGTAQKTG